MVRGDADTGTDGGGQVETGTRDGSTAGPGSGGEAGLDTGQITRALAQGKVYPTRPVRPWTRTLMRVGLWGAVVLGAVGGILGLFSLGGDSSAADDLEGGTTPLSVPAGVGGMAELVVEEWLLATDADRSRVEPLFVEAPSLPHADDIAGREVLRTRAVAGEFVDDGYWAVTVRVDLREPSPGAGDGATDDAADGDAERAGVDPGDGATQDAQNEAGPTSDGDAAEGADGTEDGNSDTGGGDDAAPELATWFVEVGIVGEEGGALAALRTPAVMPPPPDLAEGWTTRGDEVREPGLDDEETGALEDFLRAVLAGDGDPSRYTAPGVELPVADPAVFSELEVSYVAVEDVSETIIRAQVHVDAVTPGGVPQQAAYEVVAEWRDGRLEILELWGAASLRGRPEEPAVDSGGESPDADEGTGEVDE